MRKKCLKENISHQSKATEHICLTYQAYICDKYNKIIYCHFAPYRAYFRCDNGWKIFVVSSEMEVMAFANMVLLELYSCWTSIIPYPTDGTYDCIYVKLLITRMWRFYVWVMVCWILSIKQTRVCKSRRKCCAIRDGVCYC